MKIVCPQCDFTREVPDDRLPGAAAVATCPQCRHNSSNSLDSLKQTALKIRSLEASKEEIANFVETVKEKGGIEYATRMMYEFRDKALALVPASADSSLKEALTAYIDYVIERNK